MKDIKDDLRQVGMWAAGILLVMAATGQGVFEDSALYEESAVATPPPQKEPVYEVEQEEMYDPFLNPNKTPLETLLLDRPQDYDDPSL